MSSRFPCVLFVPLCLAFVTYCSAEDVGKPKPPTPDEIREAKVYETLGELVVRRDDLLKKFAVVMHGELALLGMPTGPKIGPTINARIVDRSRSFDLRAGYMVYSDSGPNIDNGLVTIRIGTVHKAIPHNPFTNTAIVKPPETKLSEWKREYTVVGGADPYDDYIAGAMSFFSIAHGTIDEGVLSRYKLESTELGAGGKLISHWSCNPNKHIDWRIAMEFDPAHEMMPTSVKIQNQVIKNDFQETRLTWRKHGKTMLPYRIEYSHGDMTRPNVTSECTFRCYWLVGDEVPDKIVVPDQPDNHLGELLDHFKIEHSRRINGKVVPYVHELPEDLYEQQAKKKP